MIWFWQNIVVLTGSPSTTAPLASRTTMICCAWKVITKTGPCSIILPAAICKGSKLQIIQLTHWPLGNVAVISQSVILIFILLSRIDILSISCKTAPRSMPQDITDDKSTLVQVMVPSGNKPLPEPKLNQFCVIDHMVLSGFMQCRAILDKSY